MSTLTSPAEPASVEVTSSAIAKAKLLTVALNNASRARLSTTTHAVLAHLVADAWPSDDGWAAHTSQTSLATRLATSIDTIARAIKDLDAAQIGSYKPGRGTRRSRFVVAAWVRIPTPHRCGDLPAPVRVPTPHGCGDIPDSGLTTTSTRAQNRGGAGAASSIQIVQEAPTMPQETPPLLSPSQEALRATIVSKPSWLRDDDAWVDNRAARELAALPSTSIDSIEAAHRATRSRRKTLTNPAGFFLTRLRNPDPADVASAQATRERAAARRAAQPGQRDAAGFFSQERARLADSAFAQRAAARAARSNTP